MKTDLLMNFLVDKESKKIHVDREFAAPLDKVWAAWTQSEILDQWWAPKPWHARTKFMDFSVGGYWLYAMVGPEGEEHWARADYSAITPEDTYTAQDAFCDEEGVINTSYPGSTWTNKFVQSGTNTKVHIEISYDDLKDLEATLEMGFQKGFTMGLQNLDELFQ
ncbi:SRPBCC domain-containing protein [Dyadobacter luteus]|uniref:SRPBCC domain-containing protein n=1 Tax=Dyadobacter luteus TaxID=2259619 RepID=A0A3D8Y7L3_9BACT|nr:SRPBCC domain-containing protein [Dyadobacter luteus]REA59002.1 SRPBCC domain-containing protein [Dyadobacter luteus]